MIYRGKVIKIDKDFAIVLTKDMEYMKIVRRNIMFIGQQIIFVKEDIFKEKSVKIQYKSLYIAAAIMIILFSSIFSDFKILNGPSNVVAAVMSLDINPSVEFEINEDGKVLRVVPINNDGKDIINEELTRMNIEESIFIVVNNAKSKNYITTLEEPILLTTAAVKDGFVSSIEGFEKRIEDRMLQSKDFEQLRFVFLHANKKDLELARQYKISIGMYEIFIQSRKHDPKTTLDQIKSMRIQEIVDSENHQLRFRYGKNKPQIIDNINASINNEATDSENNNEDPSFNFQYRMRKNNIKEETNENGNHENGTDGQYRSQWRERNNQIPQGDSNMNEDSENSIDNFENDTDINDVNSEDNQNNVDNINNEEGNMNNKDEKGRNDTNTEKGKLKQDKNYKIQINKSFNN